MTQKCKTCNKELDLDRFNSVKKNGKKYFAKTCYKCAYLKNKEYLKEYNKTYRQTENYKQYHSRKIKEWMEKNSSKVKAHQAAKRDRKILKNDYCEECGIKNVALYMHHPDYNKPKYVVTLCLEDHERIHHEK